MKVWCSWCGAAVEVPPRAAGQQLGCLACRRVFTVPHGYDASAMTDDEVLAILSERGVVGDLSAGAARRMSESAWEVWATSAGVRRVRVSPEISEDEILKILSDRPDQVRPPA